MQPHKYHIRLNGQEKQAFRQLKRNGKTERRLANRPGSFCGPPTGLRSTKSALGWAYIALR